jgi:hypothetical protein
MEITEIQSYTKHLIIPKGQWMTDLKELPYIHGKLGDPVYSKAFTAALKVIDNLLTSKAMRQHRKRNKAIPLDCKSMEMICGSNYMWNLLKKHIIPKVLLSNGKWSKKHGQCLKYKFSKKWENAEFTRSDEEYVCKRRVSLQYPEISAALKAATIDRDDAFLYLTARYHRSQDTDRPWEVHRLEAFKGMVERFSDFYTVGRTGRVFCVPNMIPKECRKIIKINENCCAEVDLGNSQVLLLATLYENTTTSAEYERYCDMVQSGQFYECLMTYLGIEHTPDNRESMKKPTFGFLFGSAKTSPEVDRFFSEKFPELYAIITKKRKQHYKALVYYLQKLEAEIIVEMMCRDPRFLAIPIHDGLLVEEQFASSVAAMLKQIILEKLGLCATVTIDYAPNSEFQKAA